MVWRLSCVICCWLGWAGCGGKEMKTGMWRWAMVAAMVEASVVVLKEGRVGRGSEEPADVRKWCAVHGG